MNQSCGIFVLQMLFNPLHQRFFRFTDIQYVELIVNNIDYIAIRSSERGRVPPYPVPALGLYMSDMKAILIWKPKFLIKLITCDNVGLDCRYYSFDWIHNRYTSKKYVRLSRRLKSSQDTIT